jgi:hypothetical protein
MTTEKFGLVGRTKIYKGTQENPEAELIGSFEKDLLADGSFNNAIFPGESSETTSPTGLKSYLAQVMSSASPITDRALNNLFTSHEVNDSQDTKDGIVVMESLGNYGITGSSIWTMITTPLNTTTPFARKWKGVATVVGSPKQWSAAAIGWNWSATPDKFSTTYATQSFTTVILGIGEVLTIEWEIALV